jgi:DNA-binding transcriptional LysR family regulator
MNRFEGEGGAPEPPARRTLRGCATRSARLPPRGLIRLPLKKKIVPHMHAVQCILRIGDITVMHVDLNLLPALDALLEEKSVSMAAARLHLSQPAMSRTLSRIRDAMGDEILVRAGRSMMLTPRAVAIRQEVQDLVRQAQAMLARERELDLASLERTFSVRCHDAVATALGPRLLALLAERARGVNVRFLGETTGDTDDLRHGRVDLDVSANEPAHSELRRQVIGHDRLVVVTRSTHPAVGRRLTRKRYAEALHVIVSRRGRLKDPIDDALAAHGLRRRVVASAPTSSAALHWVRETDLMVAVPANSCSATVQALGLCTSPLPLELGDIPIIQAWHPMFERDAAHTWFRGQVREVLRALCADDPPVLAP